MSRAGIRLFMIGLIVYFFVPFWWLLVSSTKSSKNLFDSAAFWFSAPGSVVDNLRELFTQQGHAYLHWMGNTVVYSILGGAGATAIATLAGYSFAKFTFPGRRLLFSALLGMIMVPATALVIPTYLLLSKVHLTDTIWAVILPSLLNPFGVYLVRVYVQESVPNELLEAARIDGAGEIRTFARVALPVIKPALVTVLLFSMVATWNNFFLPLVMLSDDKLYPLTVGLQSWLQAATIQSGNQVLFNLIITGSLVSILPLVITFLLLQRYWRGGLTLGSLK
ncbi:carbohydrate ABC transporter permease [Microbispora sp. NPDC046933]|uniref:carbohydrate ABC transporter permease n=1 Tax=Microbispora sp. NPDC046933 TaxID=3155618 RepID=UPI0033D9E27A